METGKPGKSQVFSQLYELSFNYYPKTGVILYFYLLVIFSYFYYYYY